MTEKLLKSLENLKLLLLSPHLHDDASARKKEKIAHCTYITDVMCSPGIKSVPSFSDLLSIALDILLQLCDDPHSDVRMVADESLNKIIRVMQENNVMKIQIELHKAIKNNGNARTLRAALWRFAELCHMIRPQKRKPYALNLIPYLTHIAQRTEESVLETLANAMPKIFQSLGCFTGDNQIKNLLKAFLHNLSSDSAVVRRTAAASILAVCMYCRKPQVFFTYILNTLLDCVIPVHEGQSVSNVLGVLGCLRNILSHLDSIENDDDEIRGSFGVRRKQQEAPQAVDRLIQVYELCLHYTNHMDHNVVNAALETLHQLLQNPPRSLIPILLSTQGITRSRIHSNDAEEKLSHRTLSQMSVAPSLTQGDISSLDDTDADPFKMKAASVEKWINESDSGVIFASSLIRKPTVTVENTVIVPEEDDDESFESTVDEVVVKYSDMKIGQISDQNEMYCSGQPILSCVQSSLQSEDGLTNIDDEFRSQTTASPSPTVAGHATVPFMVCNIGLFTDPDVPLHYCVRHLASSFLLTGHTGYVIPDKSVRVSVKALALNCVASILRLLPDVFRLTLDKTKRNDLVLDGSLVPQTISDVLLFASHSDPQLRAITSIVIANLLKSALIHSGGNFTTWLGDFKSFTLIDLIRLLLEGLRDESSVCCRQALVAVSICLSEIIESTESLHTLSILNVLPDLVSNPYWLVKVKLLEVVSDIPYITVHYLSGNSYFQDKIINSVIMTLLHDEDARVRHAAAESIVKIVPNLFFPMDRINQDSITAKGVLLSNMYLSQLLVAENSCNHSPLLASTVVSNLPPPFDIHSGIRKKCPHYSVAIDGALSRLINQLSMSLLVSHSKFPVFGCSEALSLLSLEYCTTVYPQAWNCVYISKLNKKISNPKKNLSEPAQVCESSAAGLLSTTMCLLTSSPVSLDLSCQQWLLHLAGNMFSGLALNCLHPAEYMKTMDAETLKQHWIMFKDKQLISLADQLLVHVVKLLNIFVHVIEDTMPSIPTAKPSLPTLPTSTVLSPIKIKVKSGPGDSSDDKSEDKKSGRNLAMGLFANNTHYMKIYEVVKSAYINYKITLDAVASEKFVSLLRITLETLCQLLEVGSLPEASRIVEEVLSYFCVTVSIEPTSTVNCVQQLLKCLFATNLSSHWEDPNDRKLHSHHLIPSSDSGSFYTACFQVPYNHLTEYATSSTNKSDKIESSSVWSNYFRRRKERKLSANIKSFNKGADKATLASYIRLFEPMVIKSLRQYTVTSNVHLQCQVLLLLSQLVQLKINYCLLDSDQIFIKFVLEQFEYIEEGQILQAQELIPKVFYFLVQLSYEKNHSKCIISIPKVIQLCDGLMASGQPPVTHCIPALVPVVEDVFLARGSSCSPADLKELDTQREVLVSMLLRLVEYYQVLELLTLVLNESRQGCEGDERWRRWSRQVIETLLPLLAQGRVRLDSRQAQQALHNLLGSMSPSVFRPVDSLLKVLFSEFPSLHSSLMSVERWLGMILAILLLLISHGKEEVVLARLEELDLPMPVLHNMFQEEYVDPLNAAMAANTKRNLTPERVLAKFLLRVLGLVSRHIYNSAFSSVTNEKWNYLQEQYSHFLLFCIHMFESGSYCKVANAASQILHEECDDTNDHLPIDDINTMFLELASRCPLLTFLWCYLLTLLNYSNQKFWTVILRSDPQNILNLNLKSLQDSGESLSSTQSSPCINLEVARKGAIILYSDYVCENLGDAEQLSWLLVNHVEDIVKLSVEPPVRELIAAVHRNPAASGLLIQAVGLKCQNLVQPSFVVSLLRCLEGVHTSQSGALLLLLVPQMLGHPHLALSRLVGALACRNVEVLLTLNIEEVESQLTQVDLKKLLDTLYSSNLAYKHPGLTSLLRKLGLQFYNMSPAEEDGNKALNPISIQSIDVNKDWFYSQVKHRCCQSEYCAMESAQMLNKLEYDDIISIMSCEEFNTVILEDCLKFGTQLIMQAQTDLPNSPAHYDDIFVSTEEIPSNLDCPLYCAARLILLRHVASIRALIPSSHQVYNPLGRDATNKEIKYSQHLEHLLMDPVFWNALFQIVPAVTCYLQSLSKLNRNSWSTVSETAWDDLAKFGVLCLEAVHWLLKSNHLAFEKLSQPFYLCASLSCVDAILQEANLAQTLSQISNSWVASSCNAITAIMQFLLDGGQLPAVPSAGLKSALSDPDTMSIAHSCLQMSSLVCWLEKTKLRLVNIPSFLMKPVRSLIIALSRMPSINSYVATPPNVWRHGWIVELSGPTCTTVPPVPVDYLQDIELLQQLIFRITLLGWTSRQQFEETWMALLSVLSSNPDINTAPEEAAIMFQASCLAVQAITTLLIQTLLLPMPGNPNNSHLLHQPRDRPLSQTSLCDKLKAVHELLCWRIQEQEIIGQNFELEHVFYRGNLERHSGPTRFGYSQVSLEYLWTATRILEDQENTSQEKVRCKGKVSSICLRREQCLAASGLDLHSCLHFLLDLYTQWTVPQSDTPLRLVNEAIRSVLAISDLFTEKAQFQWMLNICLELSRSHPPEDEVLHQYLVLGACKAAAVLGMDTETQEHVRKLVESSLRSAFLPSRLSALYGTLYLLQSASLGPSVEQSVKKTGASDESFQIVPLAIEYIQKHIDNGMCNVSEEHQLVTWGLAFYLLENMEEQMTETELTPTVLQLILNLVTSHHLSPNLHLALLYGLERLVVSRSVGGKVREQVTKLAVERLRHTNPSMSIPALQLLLTCMYTGKFEEDESNETKGKDEQKESDPEHLIQAMEKTSTLFDRIKCGYPCEVELLCGVLSNLLVDFFPASEILTKVIGEFLSSHQPHPHLLAGVVFQVFERACKQSQLGLLQHWVVLSLSNFTQCSPVGMATWCLTCFFICASTNPWLRAIFPHVQSRMGKCEEEDRILLCIAAVDFYNQLTDENQKQTFMSTFQAATQQARAPFSDLISCL